MNMFLISGFIRRVVEYPERHACGYDQRYELIPAGYLEPEPCFDHKKRSAASALHATGLFHLDCSIGYFSSLILIFCPANMSDGFLRSFSLASASTVVLYRLAISHSVSPFLTV